MWDKRRWGLWPGSGLGQGPGFHSESCGRVRVIVRPTVRNMTPTPHQPDYSNPAHWFLAVVERMELKARRAPELC